MPRGVLAKKENLALHHRIEQLEEEVLGLRDHVKLRRCFWAIVVGHRFSARAYRLPVFRPVSGMRDGEVLHEGSKVTPSFAGQTS